MKKESTLSNELLSTFQLSLTKTAAIYSPTFTQYHRRGWA